MNKKDSVSFFWNPAQCTFTGTINSIQNDVVFENNINTIVNGM